MCSWDRSCDRYTPCDYELHWSGSFPVAHSDACCLLQNTFEDSLFPLYEQRYKGPKIMLGRPTDVVFLCFITARLAPKSRQLRGFGGKSLVTCLQVQCFLSFVGASICNTLAARQFLSNVVEHLHARYSVAKLLSSSN